jgi:DNA repair protein RadC
MNLIRLEYAPPRPGPQLMDPGAAAQYLRSFFHRPQEHFLAVPLDSCLLALGIHVVGVGGPCGVQASPRDAFLAPILANAVAVLFAHNHPYGSEGPSEIDRLHCAELFRAGEILGVDVWDYIILVRAGVVWSARRAGLIRSFPRFVSTRLTNPEPLVEGR